MTRRASGRHSKQPSGPARIDWSNPLANQLQFATYATESVMFFDYANGKVMVDPYAGDSFTINNFSPTGRGKANNGGGYCNTATWQPYSKRPGKATILAIVRPRFTSATTTNPICTSGELLGTWDMANISVAPSNKFSGNCVNGTVITSDVTYTPGKTYSLAFTNDGVNAKQVLFVDGAKQSGLSSYGGNYDKVIDNVAIGRHNVGNSIDVYAVFVWARVLTDKEIAEISANPYQLFAVGPTTPLLISEYVVTNLLTPTVTYVNVVGSSSGYAAAQAVAQAIALASGFSQGVGTVAAGASSVWLTKGTSSGATSGGGVAISVFPATGSGTGTSSNSAAGAAVVKVNGASTGSGTASGNAAALVKADGTSVGGSTAGGNGTSVWSVTGIAGGTSALSGTAQAVWLVSGNSNGQATVQGGGTAVAVATPIEANGQSYGTCVVAGIAQAISAARGSTGGTSSLDGHAAIVAVTNGTTIGTSTTHGTVVTVFESIGLSVGAAEVDGIVAAIVAAVGKSTGTATVSGITTGGLHYTAMGDKFNITLVLSQYGINHNDSLYAVKRNPSEIGINLNN